MKILRWRAGRGPIPPLLVIGAIIALALVLLALAFMVIRGFDQSRELRAEVIRSYETRAELQHVLSLHSDIETAQRGFQLTGDVGFLQPYSAAVRELDATFVRLESGLSPHSAIRDRLPVLRRYSRDKRQFVDEIISRVRQGDDAEAQELVAAGRGKRAMDRLRAEIAFLDGQERAQLVERTLRSDHAMRRLQRLNAAINAALFLTIAAAVFFAMRSYAEGVEAMRRLEDLSKRQEAVFESATDGMIVLNPSGSIESLNDAVCTMYGYKKSELVRRDVGILFEVAPDRGRVETFLKRLSVRRADHPGQVQGFVAARKDGTTFPTEVTVSPVHLADRSVYLAVIRDVTERKNIERMKNEFVSTVSHELRTPLTSIAGSLGLLTGGAAGEIPERALRLVEIAKSNCTRLVRLINDILDIEKIASGKMRFDVKPVPLGPFLEQALQANRGFAAEQRVEMVLQPVPAEARVMADEDRMMQVMANLLSNAAKFSPPGETVQVSVQPLDRRYRISVADNGPGIEEGFREQIFGKFAQADSSITKQKGGTGLGLSIVREIVTRLRGSVSFDSEPGKGAVFHVDLPAATGTTGDLGQLESRAPSAPSSGLQILHVDDDPDMLRVVSSAFEGKAEIRSTRSLAEARAAILDRRFDAVILDIGMQDGSGLELVPLLQRRDPRTPVVVFTAQDASFDHIGGVDAVLIKSRASLDVLVEDVMERATAADSETKA